MDLIKKEELETIIKNQDVLTFNELDKIFYHLPKDINSMIFKYYSGYCERCFSCCGCCRMYCYYDCYREMRGTDVCCKWSLRAMTRQFDFKDKTD